MTGHFIEQFNRTVKLHGMKPAIYFGKRIYTFDEINQLSNNIANKILSFNLPKETIIPLLLERTPNLIITMLGVLKSGSAFLPISPSSPCSRIEYILEETKSTFLFCDTANSFKLTNDIKRINPESLLSEKTSPINKSYENTELAYVMYTSGSTGKPKGVLIEHQSMMNLFLSLTTELRLNDRDCFLALTDYTFDISLIELLMPFTFGASIVLTEQGTVADGKKIKEYRFNITFIQATPLTWEILLKNNWCNDGTSRILVGGEKFKTSLALKLNYEKGNIWNVYGPTETSMWSMIHHLKDRITTESVPLGKPIANTRLKLVYEPNAVQAELFIGGLGLARGYLNAKELTSNKFIYDKQENERFYKTGDLVTEWEDLICYVGRKDDQLKFGGIRIEAGEIEAAIEQETFVKKAVVKIHEHEDYYKTLAAYVELDEAMAFSHLAPELIHTASFFIEKIYDETYSRAKDFENDLINTCGWQNSFTGNPFQPNELVESYINIREWINKSNLTNVLEVGCGTGSLILEYLPKAEKVTLLEVSNKAINYVNSILPRNLLDKVQFRLDSITNINDKSKYSCIVVNSVIQYLPDVKTVIASIEKLINATKSGGTILIGDIRSLELLDSFLAIKHYCHNRNNLDAFPSNLFYKSRDTEIVLSPFFFYSLKTQFRRISWVDINLKHGVWNAPH